MSSETLAALRALAEPTRLRIAALCAAAELSVSDLTQVLGQSQPRVSRHLKLMVDAGLLERHREGSFAMFRLARQGKAWSIADVALAAMAKDQAAAPTDRRRLETLRRERETRAARYFRDNAAQWDRLRALYIDERDIERRLVTLLTRRRIGLLLDIGTGTGRILEVAASHAERGLGVDLSREMLGVARSNLERAHIKNCDLRQADMYALPLANQSVDAVTVHQVLHYAEDPAAMIAEAARVLKPGGLIALADFAPHALVDLQRDHAHRHLGFADNQVFGWLSAAGLRPETPIRLPGRQLNVTIWSAERPAATLPHARPVHAAKGAGR